MAGTSDKLKSKIRILAEDIYDLLKSDLDKLGIQKQELIGE